MPVAKPYSVQCVLRADGTEDPGLAQRLQEDHRLHVRTLSIRNLEGDEAHPATELREDLAAELEATWPGGPLWPGTALQPGTRSVKRRGWTCTVSPTSTCR